MKKLLIIVAIIVGLAIAAILTVVILTPTMDRWGATDTEVHAAFLGDELVPAPAKFANRAITIQAKPEQIYPWLLQIGSDKGGWYSYDWLETAFNCPNTNADRVHPEWQGLAVGDEVLMCPGEFAPPPYVVAQLHPNQALVMGHQEDGFGHQEDGFGHRENAEWVDLYQFVLIPQTDGSTRLVLRTRTMMVGGMWNIFHPMAFIMEQEMLRGIKVRAEKTDLASLPAVANPTP
jgi:hypothetical protein